MRVKYPLVFFDVDSTLVTIEGIDELAHGNGAIAKLTDRAMSGEIPLEQVYRQRLEIIRPSAADIEALGRRYTAAMTPGAGELVAALLEGGADVHLITAGIEQAITPLTAELGLRPDRLHAVKLHFDGDGRYAGFDQMNPLTRSGGKELVILDVRSRRHGAAAFIGDGVTDVEAAGAVDLFIGFGGVQSRAEVRRRAAVFLEEANILRAGDYLMEAA